MELDKFTNPVGYEPDPDNLYTLNKKEKATPYYKSYMAAYDLRPRYEDPVEPVVVDNRPLPKRTFSLVMIIIFMVALIAVLVISYLGIVPEYTSLFTKVDAENPVNNVNIGLNDVINGSMRKILATETEDTSIFYNECLADVENAETAQMIAFYALPVSLLLTLIIAIYVLIKAIVGCATIKRRKFAYIALLLLLFTLVGVVSGLVWNGQPLGLESIMGFFTFSGTNLIIGIGYYIILGIELLTWFFAMSAYRSKKKAKF